MHKLLSIQNIDTNRSIIPAPNPTIPQKQCSIFGIGNSPDLPYLRGRVKVLQDLNLFLSLVYHFLFASPLFAVASSLASLTLP
jgi:hypothetical protein